MKKYKLWRKTGYILTAFKKSREVILDKRKMTINGSDFEPPGKEQR